MLLTAEDEDCVYHYYGLLTSAYEMRCDAPPIGMQFYPFDAFIPCPSVMSWLSPHGWIDSTHIRTNNVTRRNYENEQMHRQ